MHQTGRPQNTCLARQKQFSTDSRQSKVRHSTYRLLPPVRPVDINAPAELISLFPAAPTDATQPAAEMSNRWLQSCSLRAPWQDCHHFAIARRQAPFKTWPQLLASPVHKAPREARRRKPSHPAHETIRNLFRRLIELGLSPVMQVGMLSCHRRTNREELGQIRGSKPGFSQGAPRAAA